MSSLREVAEACSCTPCESPAYGAPGIDHCAACCRGSMIEEYDLGCSIAAHRSMARRQRGIARDVLARLPEEVRRT